MTFVKKGAECCLLQNQFLHLRYHGSLRLLFLSPSFGSISFGAVFSLPLTK